MKTTRPKELGIASILRALYPMAVLAGLPSLPDWWHRRVIPQTYWGSSPKNGGWGR